ncbi:Predicted membrane protein [Amycolatopsis arida]|uniref:Predicted membrane protein n=1 Tax=Amycolatopsis arida TaxID=587909 RepID=A0A1I5WB49_9PSEU|nr:DUF2207 domain-containing protein [Amycolatopsis arida]TDX92198.1 putative membrane protein DUF2207 [Amycolatopsis arida]SFQ16973.1 Predicted membrane protein [Amycolatopsis arida]
MRVLVLALLLATPAPAQGDPPPPTLPRSVEVAMKVERDGTLSVVEVVSVPAGRPMVRAIPLRVPAGAAHERRVTIRDVVLEGAGHAELTGTHLTARLTRPSTLRYTVEGAVTGDGRVHWQPAGGWDTDLELVRGSIAAPRVSTGVACTVAGTMPCHAARIDHTGLTRFSHRDLAAGQRMELTVALPAGTVPPTARLVPARTLAGAFLLTPTAAWGWAGLAALLLGLAGWLCLPVARRTDPERLRRAGLRVMAYGVFLTVLLALTTGHAQLGLALLTAGAALVAAERVAARRPPAPSP